MVELLFLGTGGGRYVILIQRRYSGGLWIVADGLEVIVDPGPGALIRALQFKRKPNRLGAVFVSHNHLDHYNDAELMVEAMTYGAKRKKGFVVMPESVKSYFSDYHLSVTNPLIVSAGQSFELQGLGVEVTPTFNHSEDGVGFKFSRQGVTVGYTSDTGWNPKLSEVYKGCDLLILNVIAPASKNIDTHMNSIVAARLLSESKPRAAIIQHFGISMLNANPELEAKLIEERSGVRTIAAKDGMSVSTASLLEREQAKFSWF